MSNALAIAAASATLRKILMDNGIKATLKPPDAAAKDVPGDQVNLFLYRVELSPAWRNQDVPGRVRSGETAPPLLPLTLFYLLTAYTADPEDLKAQTLLGRAMQIFGDHPVLGAAEIKSATAMNVPGSDLDQQVERVRIVSDSLPTEEISKLWTAFQTPYRLSAAYQTTVLLIESRRPMRTPLPVLARSGDDRGPVVLTGNRPLLATVQPVLRTPAVRLGESLALAGEHLAGGTTAVVFRGPLGVGPFAPAAMPSVGDGEVIARLPDPAAARIAWPAGVWTAQVVVSREGEPDRASDEVPFPLAPLVTITSPLSVKGPDITVTLTVVPDVRAEQHAALLFRDHEVPAPPRTGRTHAFSFNLKGLEPGKYPVRMRIDDVDSVPIDLTARPPRFAADQTVEVR